MFELRSLESGQSMLFYVDKRQTVRGRWVPVAHSSDNGCAEYVKINREMGLQVELDENGMYRAWVLFD